MSPGAPDSFRVGLVTLVGLGGLFVVLVWLKDVDLTPRRRVRVVFTDIQRLTVGDQVRLNGVPVGKVVAIGLVPDQPVHGLSGQALARARRLNETFGGRVAVEALVDHGVRLSRRARFTIGTAGILGANYLRISQAPAAAAGGPQASSDEPLADGDLALGEHEPSLESTLAQAERFLAETRQLLVPLAQLVSDPRLRQDVRELADNLRDASSRVLALTRRIEASSDSVARDVSAVSTNVRSISEDARLKAGQALDRLRSFSGELADLARESRASVGGATREMERFARALSASGQTAEALRRTIAHLESLSAGVHDAGRTAAGIRAMVVDARTAAHDIRTVAATARGLATDPDTSGAVKGTVASVQALAGTMRDVRETVRKVSAAGDVAASAASRSEAGDRLDLWGRLGYDNRYYLILGLEDLTHGRGLNTAQVGFGLGSDTVLRTGTILDSIGVGLDRSFFRRALTATVEAFRPSSPITRFKVRYTLAGGLDLRLNVEDVSRQTVTYGGIGYRF